MTKDDTTRMKAIAVLLMLIYHLWGYPDRIAGGELKYLVNIFEYSSIYYIGLFGKICVSMFFFLGGYGTYVSSAGKQFDPVFRIKKLYISYWKVFVIFIPIAFLFFSNQPIYSNAPDMCTVYQKFYVSEFIANLLGIKCTYNEEWWFLFSYVIALITFPAIRGFVNRAKSWQGIFLVMVAEILMKNVMPNLGNVEALGVLNSNYLYCLFFCQFCPYIACFWMGCVAARHDLITRLRKSLIENHLLTPLFDLFAILAIVFVRQSLLGDSLDIFYVPVFIVVVLDLIGRVKICNFVFMKIGKQSTNIWLIHSFFCYYFYSIVKIVVAPGWAIPSFFVLLLLTYIASLAVHYFWVLIEKGYGFLNLLFKQ